ncbi:alpha-amylase family protein [Arcticibacter sp. MXS-1]|uniref:alpha-amylase family protein n=1 Tax=Arcticibacter sp. MXS-1 TaxID=3341726 RepID=UPI0035A88C4A
MSSSSAGSDRKVVVYQMLVRLFGNQNSTNKHYGSLQENGCGKFSDISDKALDELKKLGVSHVWYTGVIEHATMTDYSAYGIKNDDPDVVKGRAGSPYAIKDYYDVDPDLAVNVKDRMKEFGDLVARTHKHQLKVLIDFVPNHVARTYHSDARPAGVKDFGEEDNKAKAFDPRNDFYYIPGKSFTVPKGVNAGGDGFSTQLKDGRFNERPAKATGNNVFAADPSVNDWFETIKLNYGVDYQNGEKKHFDPIPPVWEKMRDILLFWASKDVDGFRCDVAEMVPVEFWHWVIPQVKEKKPGIVFLAEAYDPKQYRKYLTTGKFDYLYDKVGLYDGLKRLIRNEPKADVRDISYVAGVESKNFSSRMLRFLENHDEERIASSGFAGNPWLAVPAMVVSATLSGGPVMIYFGQEVGEPGKGNEGFGTEDNRTTIFDYWGVPEHQKWMNKGAFDGALLSEDQKKLRSFYSALLNFSASSEAVHKGKFFELNNQKGFNKKTYAYLRYTTKERLLIVVNFDRKKQLKTKLVIPQQVLPALKLKADSDVEPIQVLTGEKVSAVKLTEGIPVDVLPSGAAIYKF